MFFFLPKNLKYKPFGDWQWFPCTLYIRDVYILTVILFGKVVQQVCLEDMWSQARRFPCFKNWRPLNLWIITEDGKMRQKTCYSGSHSQSFICQIITKIKIFGYTFFFKMDVDILKLQWRKWKMELAVKESRALCFRPPSTFHLVYK